jgi:transcriptional regulator of NAD metabolism
MEEHIALLKDHRLSIPSPKRNPTVIIRNAKKLAVMS